LKVIELNNPSKILKIYCYTPISKPLNGSLPRSNTSHLLRLHPVEYTYKDGKEKKTSKTETYLIKGIRGSVRHQVMKLCLSHGIEVCHTSDKETDKHGNQLLPDGFHLIGSCINKEECIIHQVFGSKGSPSLISVYADPITSINHATAKTNHRLQNVQIATEHRMVQSYDGKAIQDFGERYFSGEFSFEINVTRCDKKQLGLLIESIMNLQKLGGGYNSGYGRIEVKRFHLLERSIKRFPEWKDNSFIVKEEVQEKSQKRPVLDAIEKWNEYLKEVKKCN
jgi:CRISPR/Cas system CSM-associated protein Csm3 (group 7 of RAMP superfamily)